MEGKKVEDLREKIKSQENSLEQLARKIPGFMGYKDREQRRNADKIQRTYMAEQLAREKSRLLDTATPLSRGGNLELVAEVDRLSKLLDKITDKIRYADYGYTGFFDSLKINEAELDRVYEFDLELADLIGAISEATTALESAIEKKEEGAPGKLKTVEAAIKKMEERFSEREKVLKGVS
jgi:hypothetical protein